MNRNILERKHKILWGEMNEKGILEGRGHLSRPSGLGGYTILRFLRAKLSIACTAPRTSRQGYSRTGTRRARTEEASHRSPRLDKPGKFAPCRLQHNTYSQSKAFGCQEGAGLCAIQKVEEV